jgi:NADH-quinone oxidoreductase subunit H
MDLIDWELLIVRVGVVFFALLISVMLLVWIERKVLADMQTRKGPMRAGPRGILITFADGIKLFFKEGIMPTDADKWVFIIAPTLSMLPAFLAFAVIPFGAGVRVDGRYIPFQLANLNVGVLWVLAMSSIAIYGIVLAGWASGSRYPLLGAIRSTAQMISYEVGMGLALVAVIMWSGTLSMQGIVHWQQTHVWNVIPQFPAFVIYLIAGIAETNRPPFDLAEAETELVAGFHTEYSGIRFAIFFLAEYLWTITISAIAVTLFLGGWLGPHISFLPWLWPLVWFLVKLGIVLYFYIWVRATIPRLRYDRLMSFGWKVLIPFGLVWVMATGAIVILPNHVGRRSIFLGLAAIIAVLFLLSFLWPQKKPEEANAS